MNEFHPAHEASHDHNYCMPSGNVLADAGRHLLSRTYAGFSEELIRNPDNIATAALPPRNDGNASISRTTYPCYHPTRHATPSTPTTSTRSRRRALP